MDCEWPASGVPDGPRRSVRSHLMDLRRGWEAYGMMPYDMWTFPLSAAALSCLTMWNVINFTKNQHSINKLYLLEDGMQILIENGHGKTF